MSDINTESIIGAPLCQGYSMWKAMVSTYLPLSFTLSDKSGIPISSNHMQLYIGWANGDFWLNQRHSQSSSLYNSGTTCQSRYITGHHLQFYFTHKHARAPTHTHLCFEPSDVAPLIRGPCCEKIRLLEML